MVNLCITIRGTKNRFQISGIKYETNIWRLPIYRLKIIFWGVFYHPQKSKKTKIWFFFFILCNKLKNFSLRKWESLVPGSQVSPNEEKHCAKKETKVEESVAWYSRYRWISLWTGIGSKVQNYIFIPFDSIWVTEIIFQIQDYLVRLSKLSIYQLFLLCHILTVTAIFEYRFHVIDHNLAQFPSQQEPNS